jgi:hypothetical protein
MKQSYASVANMQPDELNALRSIVKEFVGKVQAVDNEITLLKDDRKEIVAEYAEKLDLKTLNAALKVVQIQQGVEHKDTYDLFCEVLSDPAQ